MRPLYVTTVTSYMWQHIYGMKKQQAVFILCETKGKMIFCPKFWRVLRNLLLKINSILLSSMEIIFVYSFVIRRRTREWKIITTLSLLEYHLWCWRKYKKTFNISKIIKQTKMYLVRLKYSENWSFLLTNDGYLWR